ncbi:MAG: 3'-5' exonuclease [Trueperaceae bacterium]|nr:MAG: 3'-5' exonuclease [Trueperaceae bacterium]
MNRHGTSWLRRLFEDDFVVLDTETTGLGSDAEVVDIGVVDRHGQILLESLVRPRSGHVPSGAARVHGLTMRHLQAAPTWPEVLPSLIRAVAGRRVLAWNAPFDRRMLEQSSRAWDLRPLPIPFECAMHRYALSCGVRSGRYGLERAASREGVLSDRQQHRSVGDARLTLAVLKSIFEKAAKYPSSPYNQDI